METVFRNRKGEGVELAAPVRGGGAGLNEMLQTRRSVRHYRKEGELRVEEISQLLWAAQGMSSREGYRTCPSAGALYPLEVYLIAGRVSGLAAGIYHYDAGAHRLICVDPADRHEDLTRAALHQDCVRQSTVVLAIAAVPRRITIKYGRRGVRYMYMEAGHAAQNVLLTVTSLGLAAVPVGAFDDADVSRVLGLRGNERPLYLIPIGRV